MKKKKTIARESPIVRDFDNMNGAFFNRTFLKIRKNKRVIWSLGHLLVMNVIVLGQSQICKPQNEPILVKTSQYGL